MITRVIDRIAAALMILACLTAVLMLLHICADVLCKYVFNMPIDGTLETVSGWYMVAVVFGSMAYVEVKDGHISVDLFTRHIPAQPLSILRCLTYLLSVGYLGLMTWVTAGEAIRRTANDEVWETVNGFLPIWPSRWLVPIGMASLAAVFLLKAVRGMPAIRGRS